MTERVAATPGLYPLPDWAKETLSDLKGHQKGDLLSGDESEAIVKEYDEVRTEYVNDQLDAGLDRVVEGQGRWDDMIAHPLTVHDSVETGGSSGTTTTTTSTRPTGRRRPRLLGRRGASWSGPPT